MCRLPCRVLVASLCAFLLSFSSACSSDDGDNASGGGEKVTDAGSRAPDATAGSDSVGGSDAGSTAKDSGASTGGNDAGTSGPKDGGGVSAPSKHNSFDTALPLIVGGEATGEQLAPTGESDYYTFEGKKGDAIAVVVSAQDVAYEKVAIDTVVILYDADKKQIAENDDPTPRMTNDSQLFTILPKDGKYYVEVLECWTWLEKNKVNGSCADPKDKTKSAYKLLVGKLNTQLPFVVQDEEKGDEVKDATTLGYGKTANGNSYQVTRVFGTFTDNKDVDWYRFVAPNDLDVGKSRLTGIFEAHPHGKTGSGATNSAGWAAISLASAPTATIAKVNYDNKGSDLWIPLQGGKEYLLSIKHPGTGAGTNDFYFVSHQLRGDNPLEQKDATNGDVKTPEELQQSQTTSELPGWFVAGEITKAGEDVDHYALAIPAGYEKGKISVFCAAQRAGSGLRKMTMKLLKADGSEIAGAKWVEDDLADASIKDVAVNNEAKLILQITAQSQAVDVSSKYYRCGAVVQK